MSTVSVPLPYVSRFAGTAFHMHAVATAAAYQVPGIWTPPPGSHIRRYGPPHVPWCWEHDSYPEHVLYTPQPGSLVVTQLVGRRNLQQLRDLADEALGAGSQPRDICCYPLSVRAPLVAIGPLQFQVPGTGMHMHRVWPPHGDPAFMTHVRGRPVEIRIEGNRHGLRPATFAAAAFVGRAFETSPGKPRSEFFASDATHVLMEPNPRELDRFTAALMDRVLNFVHDDGVKLGVFLDPTRRLPGTQLGKVYKQRFEDDVEYRMRLPIPGGGRRKAIGLPPCL